MPHAFAGKLPTGVAVVPRKFACSGVIVSPNAVAVVVPARHAYSHCASVGNRNRNPSPFSVNNPQNRSAST